MPRWARDRRVSTAVSSVLPLRPRPRPRRLLLTVRVLVGEHLFLGAARAAALLAPDARPLLGGCFGHAAHARLELVGEEAPGEKAVQRLRTLLLALHHEARRHVAQDHAGRDLVHVLAAATARAAEGLLEVLGPHAEPAHAGEERRLLLRRHGEHRASACRLLP